MGANEKKSVEERLLLIGMKNEQALSNLTGHKIEWGWNETREMSSAEFYTLPQQMWAAGAC